MTDGEEDSREGAAGRSELRKLRKRVEFTRASRGRRVFSRGFVLQGRYRGAVGNGNGHIGFGVTCSRKLGNAVTRNRAKRRLRELARTVLPYCGVPGWDYVLIGLRNETNAQKFSDLQCELRKAVGRLHRIRKPGSG